MPLWLAIASLGLGFLQNQQAVDAQNRALQAAQQGTISDEELADYENRATAKLKGNLASRGVLDSDLFTGGLGKISRDRALLKAQGRSALSGTYINALLNRANQPSFLSSFLPLALQHGIRGTGENWLIRPATGVP